MLYWIAILTLFGLVPTGLTMRWYWLSEMADKLRLRRLLNTALITALSLAFVFLLVSHFLDATKVTLPELLLMLFAFLMVISAPNAFCEYAIVRHSLRPGYCFGELAVDDRRRVFKVLKKWRTIRPGLPAAAQKRWLDVEKQHIQEST